MKAMSSEYLNSSWMEEKTKSEELPQIVNMAEKMTSKRERCSNGDDEEDPQLFDEVIPTETLQIGKAIGEGAFGSVHLSNLYGQPVAVKRFKVSDDNKKEDIMNEVRVMRTLRHPNVVEYLGVAIFHGALAIVSEYMEGGTLHTLVEEKRKIGKKLPIKRVLKFLKDISRGLSWLHHRGIIHRDLKPTNILLDEGKRKCKIADFGLAHAKTSKRISGNYGMCGTLCYAAPEVFVTFLNHTDIHAVFVFNVICFSHHLSVYI